MSIEILDCLKRKRDICIKNIIPSQNTAFGFTPALIAGRDVKNGARKIRGLTRRGKALAPRTKLHSLPQLTEHLEEASALTSRSQHVPQG